MHNEATRSTTGAEDGHRRLTAAEIAAALPKGRRSGHGFVACCPAHDDRNPSLSVSDHGGRVLVKCFAGCAQEAVIEALRGRGLWPSANGSTLPPPSPALQRERANGKARTNGKRFVPRDGLDHPDKGRWLRTDRPVWTGPDGDVVQEVFQYEDGKEPRWPRGTESRRLVYLARSGGDFEELIVTEGAKDCEAGAAAVHDAVWAAFPSVGTIGDPDVWAWLLDRHPAVRRTIVWPDADENPRKGPTAAVDLGKLLAGLGRELEVLYIHPAPDAGDGDGAADEDPANVWRRLEQATPEPPEVPTPKPARIEGEIPPPVDEASYRAGIAEHLKRGYDAERGVLRARWELASWFRPLVAPHGGDRRSGQRARALPQARANAFVLENAKALHERMYDAGEVSIRWRTVEAYLKLADHEWDVIAAHSHTVRGALAWCADQRRTPEDRAELKARRKARSVPEDRQLQAKIDHLERRRFYWERRAERAETAGTAKTETIKAEREQCQQRVAAAQAETDSLVRIIGELAEEVARAAELRSDSPLHLSPLKEEKTA